MANTRQSTKRAKQALKRQERNRIVKSETKSAVNAAVAALKTKDASKVKEAYKLAVRALSKAATKGGIPKGRASRKTARLTHLVQKTMPEVLGK